MARNLPAVPSRGAVALRRARVAVRALVYTGTDTETGETMGPWTIVTDHGPGMFSDWDSDQSYRGGMGLPGAWRSAHLLAGILATVPWDEFRTVDGTPDKVSPRPPILEQPNPREARVDTLTGWFLDYVWHGNAIGIYASFGADGYPTAILPIPCDQVMVEWVDTPEPGWPVGAIRYRIGRRVFAPSEVMHVKGMHRPGDLRGMGILEAHLNGTLRLAKTLQAQATSVADHAVPSVVIESLDPEMTQAEADELKAKYLNSQRVRSPMVLNPGTKITPLAWTPDESQLIEGRNLSLVEQALLFGLDPSWVGAAQTTRTYANVVDQASNLLKFSMMEHFARFEQVLTSARPRGRYVKADLDEIQRGDLAARFEAYGVAITNGFLTRDEVRAKEGARPLTPEQRDEVIPKPPAPPAQDGPGRPSKAGAASGASKVPDAPQDANEAAARADLWPEPEPEFLERDYLSGEGDALAMDLLVRAADGANLKAYWLAGPGLAKWATNAHPWTALYHHLLKYMPAGKAKRTAAQWFHDHFGIWPGERKGKNPVGRG